MLHNDTGADVTARARAGVAAALSGLSPETSSYLLRKISPALDIAAAAVRLYDNGLIYQDLDYTVCVGCHRDHMRHDPDCPVVELRAAIRAAGEAAP